MGSGHSGTPDIGDKLADHIGDKSKIPENAITFSIFLLEAEIQVFPENSTYQGEYKKTALGSQGVVDRLELLWSFVCRAS
ncbi:hypothetical protein AVEN_195803-1 [Araneus ventricosus]|uniref:Uncharacterized protein n=1 Tax=Araneus ventricosus TaxID=182803 RepID=A0A4Y2GL44_ARAVE|nr:hypothetical protein AVEN_195803-1 [Araneus ventricosus]